MKLVTNNFKLHTANQFLESITEAANNVYYVFVGKHTAFDTADVPTPTDSPRTLLYRAFKEMIYGKKINASDVALVTRKVVWASNTVYTKYVHDADIFSNNFFVATPGTSGSYNVFKCLSNNNDSPSTYYPRLTETAADDEIYETSDGYQWKYMYSITSTEWSNFSTADYMPVFNNANVVGNAVSGSIDYVSVVDGGSGYSQYTQGTVQGITTIGVDQYVTIETTGSSTTDFYKNCAIKVGNEMRTVAEYLVTGSLRRVKVDQPFTVTPTTSDTYYISPQVRISGSCCGDGQNFQARALVNASSSNSIYKVEIVNRGTNYTFANVVAIGGITTVANSAVFKAIISPKDGHGSNPAAELGAKGAIIYSKFDSSVSGGKILDENDFRTVGIIRDPKYANVVLGITSVSAPFDALEEVVGGTSGASGIVVSANTTQVKLTNVTGFFQTSETLEGQTSSETAGVSTITQPVNYFDQTYKLVIDNVTGTFQEDEEVYQGGTATDKNANGSLYFANSSLMFVTDLRGTVNVSDDVTGDIQTFQGNTSGASAKITGVIGKDLIDYEGEVIYIENMAPVTKNSSQTETVKIILEF